MKLFLIGLLLAFALPFRSLADIGCYGSPNGVAPFYLLTQKASGTNVYDPNSAIINPGTGYCVNILASNTPCTATGYPGYVGKLANFNPAMTGCPLDSELYLLISGVGLVGFFFVRKQNLILHA